MSDTVKPTVKLIIELPTDKYLAVKTNMINDFIYDAVKHGIPLDDVRAEINKEREFARDDFRQYKILVLGVDPETVDDELPHDDFHRGMERVLEIIDKELGGNK